MFFGNWFLEVRYKGVFVEIGEIKYLGWGFFKEGRIGVSNVKVRFGFGWGVGVREEVVTEIYSFRIGEFILESLGIKISFLNLMLGDI